MKYYAVCGSSGIMVIEVRLGQRHNLMKLKREGEMERGRDRDSE